MPLRTSESVVVPAAPAVVFEHLADLAGYPAWLGLVHSAEPLADGPRRAWSVELRARVGPFARSKRLRMECVELRAPELVVFERAETDGREHSRWALRVELEPDGDGTLVTMHLAYDGALWTGGLLEKVLDEQVRRGRARRVALVTETRR